ncbi:MAG: hypothetical protein GY940_04835 [bacterium]|nr:hypothetical protein [bacterium]
MTRYRRVLVNLQHMMGKHYRFPALHRHMIETLEDLLDDSQDVIETLQGLLDTS